MLSDIIKYTYINEIPKRGLRISYCRQFLEMIFKFRLDGVNICPECKSRVVFLCRKCRVRLIKFVNVNKTSASLFAFPRPTTISLFMQVLYIDLQIALQKGCQSSSDGHATIDSDERLTGSTIL